MAPEVIAGIAAGMFFSGAVGAAFTGLSGIWGSGLPVALMLLAPALFLAGVAVGPSARPRDDPTNWD